MDSTQRPGAAPTRAPAWSSPSTPATPAIPATPATPVAPPSRFVRLLPPLVLGALVLGLTHAAAARVEDPDLWWHVLSGQRLARTGVFSGPDPFSIFSTGPWVLNQWLPELVMGWLATWWGLGAVLVAFHFVHLLLIGLLYRLCRREAGALAALIGLTVGVVGSWAGSGPRPQLVGLVLFALTLRGWLATTGDLRPRWWLVAVAWVWACSHGTWLFGAALGGVVVAGLVLDRRVDRATATRLATIPVAGLVAAVLTPTGPALFGSVRAVAAISPYLTEWAHTPLTYPPAVAVLAGAVVVALAWLSRRASMSWTSALLLAFGVIATLLYLRTVALGAVVVAPLLARVVQDLQGTPPEPQTSYERRAVVAVLAAGAVLAGWATVAGHAPSAPVSPAVSQALYAAPSGAVVLDDMRVGGWLLWQHPQVRPTIDSRAEVFGPAAMRRYVTVMGAGPGWEREVDRVRPDYALVDRSSALARALAARGWVRIAQDSVYVLLGAPAVR